MEKWQTNETIVIWIILIGLVLIILVSFFAIYIKVTSKRIQSSIEKESAMKLQYQQSLLETFIQAQEDERQRIAADIHDDLIGKLTAAKIQLENNGEIDAIEILEQGILKARSISHNLSDPLIEYELIEDLILETLSPWRDRIEIDTHIDVRSKVHESAEHKAQVLRIVQELFVNVDKHSKASRVKIQLRKTGRSLILFFSDNGIGFSAGDDPSGIGMKNIESRIQYIKGHHRIRSFPGFGTSLLLVINRDGK